MLWYYRIKCTTVQKSHPTTFSLLCLLANWLLASNISARTSLQNFLCLHLEKTKEMTCTRENGISKNRQRRRLSHILEFLFWWTDLTLPKWLSLIQQSLGGGRGGPFREKTAKAVHHLPGLQGVQNYSCTLSLPGASLSKQAGERSSLRKKKNQK